MERKIYLNMLGLAILTIVLTTLATLLVYSDFFGDQMLNALQTETEIAAGSLNNLTDTEGKISLLQDLQLEDTDIKITLVDPTGNVMFDTHEDSGSWENLSNSPEISEALRKGTGQRGLAAKLFAGNQEQTNYYAIRLADGSVLRMGNTTSSFFPFLVKILFYLFLVGMVILALATILAYRVTQNIMKPIYDIDLGNPQEDYGYDELSPFLLRIKEQNRLINAHIQSLAAEKDTIDAIVSNMREGLVLLDRTGKVLVVNQGATRLLEVPAKGHQGQPFVFMTRNLVLDKAVEEALQGKHSDGMFTVGSKNYQYIANTVYENNEIDGVVLLLFDATEEQKAQMLRQEFSANVSHELKTPLTSIFGYGEILESGIANQEDVVTFAGKIRDEASRLLSLIDDIIKLSKLDESVGGKDFELVNLLQVAESVAMRLEEMAQISDVEIIIESDSNTDTVADTVVGTVAGAASSGAYVAGEENMISEMIYNLVENSIKYNKPGGSINVLVSQMDDLVTLTVKDTGVGIPKEDLKRVVERFYRAEKSHSKKIGGTGLGLAIVKHIVQYHNATLNIESKENIGTTVTVSFPLMDPPMDEEI